MVILRRFDAEDLLLMVCVISYEISGVIACLISGMDGLIIARMGYLVSSAGDISEIAIIPQPSSLRFSR